MNRQRIASCFRVGDSLHLIIIRYALVALLAGIVCFCAVVWVGMALVENTLEPLTAENALNKSIESFEARVLEMGLSSTDILTLQEWEREDVLVALLEQERPNFTNSYRAMAQDQGRPMTRHQQSAEIAYLDGTHATVFIYVASGWMRTLCTAISLILSFVVFFICFYRPLRKKLNYITEIAQAVNIMESGDLSFDIPEHGEDELGRLAQSLNTMRHELSSSIASEHEAVQESREVITNLSHDIRTPLTILSGYVPLLLESEPLTETQRTYLTLIERKTGLISGRIDELLNFSLQDAGKQSLNLTPIGTRALLRKLSENLISLGAAVDDRTTANAQIMLDSALLQRLIDNLVSNLHQYADTSGRIALAGWETADSLCITLTNVPANNGKGSGNMLGLKISDSIMQAHGGEMHIHEQPHEYAVHLRFPLA